MSHESGYDTKRSWSDRAKAVLLIPIAGAALTGCGGIDAVPADPPITSGQNPGGENTQPGQGETSTPEEIVLEQVELDRDNNEVLSETLKFTEPLENMTADDITFRAGYWDEKTDGVITSSALYVRSIQNILENYDPSVYDIGYLIDQLDVTHFTDDMHSQAATELRAYAISSYDEQLGYRLEEEGVSAKEDLKSDIDLQTIVCPTILNEDTLFDPACSPHSGEPIWGDGARPSTVLFGVIEGADIDSAAHVNLTFNSYDFNGTALDDPKRQSHERIELPGTTLRLSEDKSLILVDVQD